MHAEQLAQQWQRIFSSRPWGRYPSEHVVRFVSRRFGDAPDRKAVRLLDLGCGAGACAWFMAREGFRVSGLDIAPAGIAQAAARLGEDRLEGDLRVGDIRALPWDDGTFDGVVDSCAMACNPYPAMGDIVREVRRVLRPGGWFLSLGFSDRCWGYGLGTPLGNGAFTDVTDGPFRDRGLMQLLSRAQVESLFEGFADRSLERATWTADGMRHEIEQWIAEGRTAR
ncbi:MAG: class I SAM-dependent methyltransferase [Polyangiales bacterium]